MKKSLLTIINESQFENEILYRDRDSKVGRGHRPQQKGLCARLLLCRAYLVTLGESKVFGYEQPAWRIVQPLLHCQYHREVGQHKNIRGMRHP